MQEWRERHHRIIHQRRLPLNDANPRMRKVLVAGWNYDIIALVGRG